MNVTNQQTNILTSAIRTCNIITWWFYSVSSVPRLATGWSVRVSNSGGGPRFSLPVQACPEAHPASCTIGTVCLSRWVKRLGLGVNHPPPSSTKVKRKSRVLPLLSLWAFMARYRVRFTFT